MHVGVAYSSDTELIPILCPAQCTSWNATLQEAMFCARHQKGTHFHESQADWHLRLYCEGAVAKGIQSGPMCALCTCCIWGVPTSADRGVQEAF